VSISGAKSENYPECSLISILHFMIIN